MAVLTSQIPESKRKKLENVIGRIKSSKTVGIVDMRSIPAKELHEIRSKLRDKMKLETVKKTLLEIAFEKCKDDVKNIEKLKENLGEMPALIVSELNPFELSQLFMNNRTPASAKPGQISPRDIIIEAGPTPFAPGPMLSDLKSKGLKVKVEAGKIAVVNDSVLVKEGEEIDEDTAELLSKFKIKPMEVGLEFAGAWEDGIVFKKEILKFNPKEYLNNLTIAANTAFKLSIGLPYPTKENIALLVSKAFNEAKTLAKEKNIFVDVLAGEMLSKADIQAKELKKFADENAPKKEVEEIKEEKTEEIKEEAKEEKTEEVKEEKSQETNEEIKEEKTEEVKKEITDVPNNNQEKGD